MGLVSPMIMSDEVGAIAKPPGVRIFVGFPIIEQDGKKPVRTTCNLACGGYRSIFANPSIATLFGGKKMAIN